MDDDYIYTEGSPGMKVKRQHFTRILYRTRQAPINLLKYMRRSWNFYRGFRGKFLFSDEGEHARIKKKMGGGGV